MAVKLRKDHVGKYVEIVWRDPCSAHVKSHLKDRSDLPRGLGVLATQRERGVIDDITDAVARIVHTEGTDSPLLPDSSTDLYTTYVPESMIESIAIHVPQSEVEGLIAAAWRTAIGEAARIARLNQAEAIATAIEAIRPVTEATNG